MTGRLPEQFYLMKAATANHTTGLPPRAMDRYRARSTGRQCPRGKRARRPCRRGRRRRWHVLRRRRLWFLWLRV